jgi:excinuclease UvrABC nuclease subunit
MKKRIEKLENGLKKLVASSRLKLNKDDLVQVPKVWGLYRIFMPRSNRTLYIGKSKNVSKRLRGDLLTPSGSHTLKNKLKYERQYRNSKIVPYLNQCRIQYITGKEYYISQLEHFAIAVLEPELND